MPSIQVTLEITFGPDEVPTSVDLIRESWVRVPNVEGGKGHWRVTRTEVPLNASCVDVRDILTALPDAVAQAIEDSRA